MKVLELNGGKSLSGKIKISGAKNASVALIPAAILADEEITIHNVPEITDTDALNEILEYLGAGVKRSNETIIIDPSTIENKLIPESISKKLRASYYFMGALLGKYKRVEMYFPGGCSIGSRPIDQHLKGFEALGAKITEKDNLFIIEADELIGAKIRIDMPGKGATTSVGATINLMLAAVKAKGVTVIENAACEPEIVNVAILLNNMGAKITGAGTGIIKIQGVDYLGKAFTEVIPDRIETGTYMIMGALLGRGLIIENIIPEHNDELIAKLITSGVKIEVGDDYAIINKAENPKAFKITTRVYPGFPTDLQQPLTTYLTQCHGESILEETIYSNRLQTVPFLNEMGANIEIISSIPYQNKISIQGKTPLVGKHVSATDLRGGASVVLAGLIAEGVTVIENIEHVLRGYENIVSKLSNVGAQIKLIETESIEEVSL